MKALIKYKDYTGKHQKTIEVERNEPNYIIREFCKRTGASKYTYIDTVRCGRTEYQWKGKADGAGVE